MTKPARTCLGCRKRCQQLELIRFWLLNGELKFMLPRDSAGASAGLKGEVCQGIAGRSGYLHAEVTCIKKGTSLGQVRRAVKSEVSKADCDSLCEQLLEFLG